MAWRKGAYKIVMMSKELMGFTGVALIEDEAGNVRFATRINYERMKRAGRPIKLLATGRSVNEIMERELKTT